MTWRDVTVSPTNMDVHGKKIFITQQNAQPELKNYFIMSVKFRHKFLRLCRPVEQGYT